MRLRHRPRPQRWRRCTRRRRIAGRRDSSSWNMVCCRKLGRGARPGLAPRSGRRAWPDERRVFGGRLSLTSFGSVILAAVRVGRRAVHGPVAAMLSVLLDQAPVAAHGPDRSLGSLEPLLELRAGRGRRSRRRGRGQGAERPRRWPRWARRRERGRVDGASRRRLNGRGGGSWRRRRRGHHCHLRGGRFGGGGGRVAPMFAAPDQPEDREGQQRGADHRRDRDGGGTPLRRTWLWLHTSSISSSGVASSRARG